MAVPFLACMAMVAQMYHLPPKLLPSIQAVEGGSVGNVSVNTNATEDLGVMQINTIWVPVVARATGATEAAARTALITLPCFNIRVAGAILRQYLNESGQNVMRAVGYYHSHTPAQNMRYKMLVLRSAERLYLRPEG